MVELFAFHDDAAAIGLVQGDRQGGDGKAVNELGNVDFAVADEILLRQIELPVNHESETNMGRITLRIRVIHDKAQSLDFLEFVRH